MTKSDLDELKDLHTEASNALTSFAGGIASVCGHDDEQDGCDYCALAGEVDDVEAKLSRIMDKIRRLP